MRIKLLTAFFASLILAFIMPKTTLASDLLIDDAWIEKNSTTEYTLSTGNHKIGDIITIDTSVPFTIKGNSAYGVSVVCAESTDLTLENAQISAYSNSPNGICALIFTGGNNTLTAIGSNRIYSGYTQPGISLENHANLCILGSGELYVYCGDIFAGDSYYNSGAAIGSGINKDAGSININMDEGGKLYAYGQSPATGCGGGAGIGSGHGGTCGDIQISGGEILATSYSGAAIGSGESGSCGNITISGGNLLLFSNSAECVGIGENGTSGQISIADSVTLDTISHYGSEDNFSEEISPIWNLESNGNVDKLIKQPNSDSENSMQATYDKMWYTWIMYCVIAIILIALGLTFYFVKAKKTA